MGQLVTPSTPTFTMFPTMAIGGDDDDNDNHNHDDNHDDNNKSKNNKKKQVVNQHPLLLVDRGSYFGTPYESPKETKRTETLKFPVVYVR